MLETTVEAEDWSGRIIVRSGIDGRIANRNVAEYRLLAHEHLLPVAAREIDPESVLLDAVTSQSGGVHIAMAARTRVMDAAQNSDTDAKRQVIDQPGTSVTSLCWRYGPGSR